MQHEERWAVAKLWDRAVLPSREPVSYDHARLLSVSSFAESRSITEALHHRLNIPVFMLRKREPAFIRLLRKLNPKLVIDATNQPCVVLSSHKNLQHVSQSEKTLAWVQLAASRS